MEDLVNINISIHPNTLYKCLSLIVDAQKPIDYKLTKEDDMLRKIVLDLILHLKNNIHEDIMHKLLLCLSHKNVYEHFIQFLNLLQNDNQPQYTMILDYLSSLMNASQYASIYEDADFHEQLIQSLLQGDKKNDDFNLDDVMKNFKSTQPVYNNNVDDKIKMLNLLDDDTFNKILSTLGLDEEGICQAKKIKQDVRENKPLDVNEILKFIQDYKENLSKSDNPLIRNILSTFGIEEDKKEEEIKTTNQPLQNDIKNDNKNEQPSFLNGIDMNNIVNMMAPLLNGLQQNRQQKRTTKFQKRR